MQPEDERAAKTAGRLEPVIDRGQAVQRAQLAAGVPFFQ